MHKEMPVIKTFKPTAHGAIRYANEWGDQLVAVRYRRHNGRRLTTIELIVDERPDLPKGVTQGSWLALKYQTIVGLKVAHHEVDIRKKLLSCRGVWSNKQKLWFCRYDRVATLGLTPRIVPGAVQHCNDVDLSFVAL